MGGGGMTGIWLALAGLLCAGGCLGDAEGTSGDGDDSKGPTRPAPGSSESGGCRKDLAYCEMPCASSADCSNGSNQGGHACLSFAGTAAKAIQADSPTSMNPSTEGERPASARDASAGDASEDDAGTDANGHKVVSAKTGNCARTCSTELCADPRMVCSSKDAGRCRPGCDETRPSCDPGQACDFDSKLCKDLEGVCESAADCGLFDQRLKGKGLASCEDRRCRLRLNPPDITQPLHSPISSREPEPLQVHRPQPGERIPPNELSSYSFQFDVPTQVIVASVLTRELKSLEDGASAARWIAYVDHSAALDGVMLADGGENHSGQWHRYMPGAAPMLPIDSQLYLLVLGYNEEQLVAKSELIPFKVSEPVIQPRTPCNVGDGLFCGDSGLVCADGLCRTPCLSDFDCADEHRQREAGEVPSCSEPGILGIKARLCF